ncbi:MAG TPA: hypothetical protein VEY91_07200 [Candidatus Limnocylindria bacterium]|nr:hypothetical protein [Candidatus Limnocylindria bacterium]
MAEPTASKRLMWLVIFAAFVVAVPMYALVAWQMRGADPPPVSYLPSVRPVLAVFAGLQLLAAILVARLRMTVDSELMTGMTGGKPIPDPQSFMQTSVVAIGLAEAPAVLGFVLCVLGAPLENFVWYGAGSLIVLLGVILPLGLRYWSAWEAQQKRTGRGK